MYNVRHMIIHYSKPLCFISPLFFIDKFAFLLEMGLELFVYFALSFLVSVNSNLFIFSLLFTISMYLQM